MTIDVAIIGAGWVVRNCYAPAFQGQTGLRPVSVYDPDFSRASNVAAALGAEIKQDFRAAVLSADCVLLAHPNDLHVADAIRALSWKRDVLCEKPVAASRCDIAALKDAADRNGKQFVSASVCRCRQDVLALAEMCSGIGDLTAVKTVWRRRAGVPAAAAWALDPKDGMTGVFADLGYHLADLVVALRPRAPPPVLSSVETRETGESPASWYGAATARVLVPTDLRAVFDWAGVELEVDVAWSGNPGGDETVIEVQGTNGRARLEGLFGFSPDRKKPTQFVEVLNHEGSKRQAFRPGPDLHRDAFCGVLADFARRMKTNEQTNWPEIECVAGMMEDVWKSSLVESTSQTK